MSYDKTAPQTKRERIIILALCIIAAFRIFLFIAAFPFFNNVDEDKHFDLVYKYSRGQLPCSLEENYSYEVAELIVLYGTLEYLVKPEQFPGGVVFPPLWKDPDIRQSKRFAAEVSRWQQENKNHETGSFPFYYTVAGLWCAAGQVLGIKGGNLLYWVRFLNVPLYAVLVWLCYLIARTFFPDNGLQRIGLPLIIAFFPQDLFYSVTNDAISPVLFAADFFLLLQLYFEDKSYRYHLFTGLVVAGTLLTKISTVVILVPFGLVVLLKVKQLFSEKRVKEYLPRLATLLAAATLPIAVWLVRNYVVLGDITASSGKIEHLGWTVKPLGQLCNHPIFTPGGVFYFLTELTKTFWRGEFTWHFDRIASYGMDLFYAVSTAVFIIASGFGLVLSKHKVNKRSGFVLGMSFSVVAVSVLLLAVLSMLYDFGKGWYPSQERPYFVSGRLISGAILPFLVIYIDGLGRIFSRLKTRVNPLIIVVLITIVITCSELLLTLEVFKSRYNWFHL